MEYYDGVWCFGQMINATVDRFLNEFNVQV